jgi:lipopolysaccharide transport system permease protein
MNEAFPQNEHVSIIEPKQAWGRLGIGEVWEYKYLLRFMVLRAIRGKYRPTAIGYGWLLLKPALLCMVYVLVIGHLFRVNSGPIPFPLFVFLGIVVYLFFAGGTMDTASSLINNASIMSKVYYPRLIAPLTSIISNFLDWMFAMVVVVLLMVVYGVWPTFQIFSAPLFILGIVGFTLAFGLVLAARTVNTRDIMLVMPALMRVLIYTMPCVYPVSMVPERFLNIYFLSPMSVFLQGLRWSLWNEPHPPIWSMGLAAVVTAGFIVYGLHTFAKAQRSMVDTL